MMPFIFMSIGWVLFSAFIFFYGVEYGVRHYEEILTTIIMLNHRDLLDNNRDDSSQS